MLVNFGSIYCSRSPCTCRSWPRRLSSTRAQGQSEGKRVSLQHKTPLFYTSKDTARVPTFLDVFNCFADDADSHVVQRHKLAPLRPWNTTEKEFELLSLNSSLMMGGVAPKNRRRAKPGSCIAAAAATPAKIETPNSAHVSVATTTTASMSLPIAPPPLHACHSLLHLAKAAGRRGTGSTAPTRGDAGQGSTCSGGVHVT